MIAAVCALVLTLAQGSPVAKATPAPAAKATGAKTAPAPSPTPTRVEAPPPYEAELLRLSEMMGALSYLRDLCRAGDGAGFRDRIARLIAADPRPQAEKDQLAGAFNRGFDSYRVSYRLCTANAEATIVAYLAESERLAKEIAARYGGG